MRVYKPSSIKWLGEIPKHWEIRRLKYLVERIIGGGTPDTSNLQYWANDENEGYLWVSIEDITNADFITDTKRYINQSGLANSSAKLLPPFSILYSIYASLGKIAYSNKILATNQAILGIQPNELLFYKFLFYYLQNTTNHIISFSNTTTQNNISLFIVANHKIPLPPLQEQKEIAEFLDSKCEKIQNYIEKKQKLITLLQEKKQALINKVVTKGLNPNIEFKNSEIEYLGLIPHHWEVKKLKYVGKVVLGKMLCNEHQKGYSHCYYLKSKNLQWLNVEVSQIEKMWFSEYEKSLYRIKKDDLLVSEGGEVGKTCIWNNELAECYIQNSVHKITLNKFNNAKFFLYLFFTYGKLGVFDSVVSRVSIAHLVLEKLVNVDMVVPPLQEQKQIANFLDEKCEKINSAIEKTKRQIALIKEYKNTLINEAVCGRIR
ncbi:hypothetical protein GN628_01980 [Campylobacter upsaliensis]|nr:hypothetical protein [Campylobacter upsaliensis]